jgi:hypothetical protein
MKMGNNQLAGWVLGMGLILLSASQAWAVATTELTSESTITDTKGSHQLLMTLDVSANGVYTHMTKGDGSDASIPDTIYDNKNMSMVSRAQKTYTTMADLEKAFGPMAGMMSSMMPVLDFKSTSDSMNVGKWHCKKVLVLQNGKEAGYNCEANYKDLGISDAQVATIQGLFKQYESFRKLTGSTNVVGMVYKDGFPVEGKISLNFSMMGHSISTNSTCQLKDVKQVDMPADKFKIPADYKHVTNMADMRAFFAGK